MSKEAFHKLEDNLIMMYVGGVHSASSILKEQSNNVKSGDKEKNLLKMCEMTKQLKKELENDNVDALGKILHESWMLKKTLASGISNPDIDRWYDTAMKNGALGGKLLGAGGGGFLLFYVPKEKQKQVIDSLPELKEMKFKFDHQGTVPVFVG